MKIIKHIGKAAALEQLAEECAELTHASLKLARILRGENPTPKQIDEVSRDVIEELTDVCLCADVIGIDADGVLYEFKKDRWKERIRQHERNKTKK